MSSKLIVGPISKGLKQNVLPFNIDNDSFPTLINAYQWRGRVKRKRGTEFLGRLTRFFDSVLSSYNSGSIDIILIDDGSGNGQGNLLTDFSLQVNGNIVPGSVVIDDITDGNTYTDPSEDGTLIGSPSGTGIINYATGAFVITGGAGDLVTGIFLYHPDLPVMGLRDLTLNATEFPGTLAFDTTYSYNIQTAFPYSIYDVSFYKNPGVDGSLPGYVPKTNPTPTTWNGGDYQQFWTTNYQGALWATNGVNVPFSITNIGMQYGLITALAIVGPGTPPAIVNITIGAGTPLEIGDFVFINEVLDTIGINYQTGYVTNVIGNIITVEFPNATISGAYGGGGIVQYLTNRSDITKDSLRFYDGDPTDGNATTPSLTGTKGWVNFAPPLSQSNFSIDDLPAQVYYLVGAKLILQFKDRILFFGPVVQTSSENSQKYLQDTVIYSQNGTSYYTVSFTNDPNPAIDNPTSPTNIYHSILVPIDQTATPSSYFEDSTGFGGYITSGLFQPIETVGPNEDVLIVGFPRTQTRLVYTGNDIVPFNFYLINSELGSASTFSTIIMDQGVFTKGSRSYTLTTQTKAERIDVEIPDVVFEVNLSEHGNERVCSQRNFIDEWIYWTYPSNENDTIIYKFPNRTLLYNYRDDSWAIFEEAYTTYGLFRKQTGFTWATVGNVYSSWSAWTTPWNSGTSSLLKPQVIMGNQQGFVIFRDDGTDESQSLYIRSFSGSTITVPDHTLNEGDYILIEGAIGTIGTQVNGKIFRVSANVTTNTFVLNPAIAAGTYFGGAIITRFSVPFIQTKQFPLAWDLARKTRIGPQKYLLTTTANSQIQLLIYLSQDDSNPYNDGPLYPDPNTRNSSLIYSTVLYTCPESTNLGLTAANTNLQMIVPQTPNVPLTAASPQGQIWHRINTSLLGDTVQLGFTLSDAQMRLVTENGSLINQNAEIELHGFIVDISPSGMLA